MMIKSRSAIRSSISITRSCPFRGIKCPTDRIVLLFIPSFFLIALRSSGGLNISRSTPFLKTETLSAGMPRPTRTSFSAVQTVIRAAAFAAAHFIKRLGILYLGIRLRSVPRAVITTGLLNILPNIMAATPSG